MMFYTGITRNASDILKEQGQVLGRQPAAIQTMHRMVEFAHAVKHELENGNPAGVGEILHQSWMLKRSITSSISSQIIDEYYLSARSAGAVGGKILGAGGGGFLLLFVPREFHESVKRALSTLRQIPFRFERDGSKIIFYNPTTLDPEREPDPKDDEFEPPEAVAARHGEGKA